MCVPAFEYGVFIYDSVQIVYASKSEIKKRKINRERERGGERISEKKRAS